MVFDLTMLLATTTTLGLSIFLLIGILILKGFALYKSARLKQQTWFWVLLITSTFGILPIIYLLISKKNKGVKK